MKSLILTFSILLIGCGSNNANISTVSPIINPVTEKDITPPFITNFSILQRSEPETNPSNTNSLFFIVHFSEPIANLTIDQFEVDSENVQAEISYVDEVGDSSQSFIISVQEISGNGELAIKIINDYSIEDQAGNLLKSVATSESWVIDQKVPEMVAISNARETNNPTFRIFFSERVYDIKADEFELITEEGNISARIDKITPSNLNSGLFSYDVTLKNVSGSGRIRLDFNHSSSDIRDYAGNRVDQSYLKGSSLDF